MARLPRLPDLLTTANLACGVASILLASQGQLTLACGLVFLAALFDVFDGLAARALGQGGTEFGKQLDSLADMVSFGVAPGMLVLARVQYMLAINGIGRTSDYHTISFESLERFATAWGEHSPMILAAMAIGVIAIGSAWRLARFNVDTKQTSGFSGLPTPANALFWTSLAYVGSGRYIGYPPSSDGKAILVTEFFSRPDLLLVVSIVLGVLMLSTLPLPSLKFKHFRWKGNEVIYLLLLLGACLLALYGVLAVPLILILYLLSPLWGKLFQKAQ